MTTPTLVTLLLAVLLTLVGCVVFGLWVTRRVRTAYRDAVATYDRVEPYLRRLEEGAEVSRRELDRVEAALAQLSSDREARRRRR